MSRPLLGRFFSDFGEASLGLPSFWGWDAFAGPFHASLDPVFTPFFIADAVVVIADAKLETTGRTDFKGAAAGFAARTVLS